MSKKLTALVCLMLVLSFVFALSSVNTFSASSVPKDAKSYGDNAYKVYYTATTRAAAVNNCRSLGGHLVYINSADELSFVKKLGSGEAWVGATGTSSGWNWDDGSAVGSFCKPYQTGTACYINLASGTMYPVEDAVSDRYAYICEWEGGADALTTTTTTTTVTTTAATTASSTTQEDDPEAITTTTTTKVTTTSSTTVAATTTAAEVTYPKVSNPNSQVRATVNFTIPEYETISQNANGETTTNAFEGVDIGETIYIYEDEYYYQLTDDGGVYITYYTGQSNEATIPSSIDGAPVKYIGRRAFQNVQMLTVTIPPSVVTIDESSFPNTEGDFTIIGAEESEAQFYASRMGYGFTAKEFTDEEAGTADETADDENENSNNTTIVIIILLVAVVVAGTMGALLIFKKKPTEDVAADGESAETETPDDTAEAQTSEADPEKAAEEAEGEEPGESESPAEETSQEESKDE